MSSKGKEKAKEVVSGKRKVSAGRIGSGAEESRRKRKNPGVLQFFEDAADFDYNDSSDDSDFDNYFMEEQPDLNGNNKSEKTHNLPFVPKEEVIEEEFDKMMEERYRDGAGFVTYAEDSYEAKGSIDRNSTVSSSKDPTIWKVKCVVGRERHSAFCLMQKFIDMKSLGNKLQIISAFSVDHIKGFFYIEADRQCDVNEACKGLTYIYSSRVAPVPSNEVYHLLTVRTKHSEVSQGMWARVKNGKYKGDLAQVVAVNNERKRATVKLIPRIDLQAMAAKFGGGVSINRTVTPAPKLISSSELEEFRPLIQYRRDRDTGIGYQILDGMMLKDGYLYKKVSIDSLSCWGVIPTEEELLKFSHSDHNESDDLEWLSQLYGEKKRKKTITNDKGGEKGEGSSGFDMENSFELYNLVCFGRKDFGLIVGMEKDDRYKILKEASEGPVVVTVEQRELKSGPLDTKFTALDQHSKTISIGDTVKVLEGQHEGKQGIVKQIYRGTIFLYDENETDNGGYFCCKSQMCEKIKQVFEACSEKVLSEMNIDLPLSLLHLEILMIYNEFSIFNQGGEPVTTDFGDFMSSPKSPSSPKKPWQEKETRSHFDRGNRDGMFSVGQTLRIRVGPLKGYLCRVLAVRYSDVTVKLDSKQKVLAVKNEHLAEVQGKSFAANTSSFKPFDILGTEGSSGDWLGTAGTSAEGGGWNAERSSWPSFSGPGHLHQSEPNHSNLFGSGDTNLNKDGEDSAWDCKVTSNQNSSWGAAIGSGDNDKKTDGASTAWENKASTKENSAWATGGSDQVVSWDSWNKAASKPGSGSDTSDAWGKAITFSGDPSGASKEVGGSWGQAKLEIGNPSDSSNFPSWEKDTNINAAKDSWKKSESWDKGKNATQSSSGAWDNVNAEKNQVNLWGKGKGMVEAGSWEKSEKSSEGHWNNNALGSNQQESWGKKKDVSGSEDGSWGKAAEKWSNKDGSGRSKGNWGSSTIAAEDAKGGWRSADGSLTKSEAVNADESSGWKKSNDFGGNQSTNRNSRKDASECATGWTKDGSQNQFDGWNKGKVADVGTSWGKQDGGSSWSKQLRGSSWGEQPPANVGNDSKGWKSQNDGWNKPRSSGSNQGSAGWDTGKMESTNGTTVEDSGWAKRGNWNSKSGSGAGQDTNRARNNDLDLVSGHATKDSSWGKKSDWNSGSAVANQDSNWGKKSSWGSGNIDAGQDTGGRKRDSWNSGSGNANQDPGWAKKNDSDFGSGDATKDSSCGKKSDWKSGSADANQDSNWGKKSSWGAGTIDASQDSGWSKRGGWDSGSSSANQDSGWAKKNDSDFGSGDSTKDSGWGKKSDWNSGSADANQDSTWGKKSSWGTGTVDSGQDSGWDKKGNWNPGSSSAGQDSGWGKKSNWNSGSGEANQDSGWKPKSNWKSGTENEDQNEPFSNRGSGGSWRGGFGGRDGSDRGFRGRWDTDRGGFRGRGRSDRGGYGGRGRSDRGGFGGRGGDGGGYGGRGGDRGGYGGRSGDREGFGGRGRGRRDQYGVWNNGSDFGENKSFGWNKEANNGEGWKNNEAKCNQRWNGGTDPGGKTWNQSNADQGGQSSCWNQSKDAKEGSWNKGTGSTNESGGSQDNKWKSSNSSDGTKWSSWNQSTGSKEVKQSNNQGHGWDKSLTNAGGSDNQGSSWDRGTGSADQARTWNQSNAADECLSSGQNESKDVEETSGNQDPWGKAASSSWGPGSGGGKGGW
ncbi:protein RNA-directed DNA methylation 3 isoform X2 [Durio zibethinus]|uniref:Protein RNA-directed DNA methylation 3 isoform X2 n=1 Tax=Durio zibethinus TaxID=66656 RepID=A0A6P6AKX8_DURZI|nr:protein RNA-directed DNA methylation 3 isoform X2 [Durio zibethinus]